jgi:hypothetical protein
MQPFKSVFGLIGALVPLMSCGGALYYFLAGNGSLADIKAMGLGPTLVGLSVFTLLASIPVIVHIFRMVGDARSPNSSEIDTGNASVHDSEFNAEAAVARYMANRPAEDASNLNAATTAAEPGARATFGRRSKSVTSQ